MDSRPDIHYQPPVYISQSKRQIGSRLHIYDQTPCLYVEICTPILKNNNKNEVGNQTLDTFMAGTERGC